MKTLYLAIVFAISVFMANGQERIISAQELHEDLDSLYAGINDIHPDMFAVISKKDFEKEVKQIKKQINRPMTATEFYVLVAPLIVKMRDGHTELQFPPWAMGENGKKVFPLLVEAPNKSTLQVTKVYSGKTDIPVGAIIKSINKRSAEKLIAKVMEYIGGELEPHRLTRISNQFTSFLWACYPWERFDIVYAYEGKTHFVTVDGISLEKMYDSSNSAEVTYPNYSFKVTDNIGIIDFRLFDDMERLKKFADSTFRILKEHNIKNLVIDIRENPGGNSAIGDTLLQYISQVPFSQYGKSVTKYSRQRIDSKIRMKESFLTFMTENEFEEYLYQEPVGTLKTYPASELLALLPNPYRYNGNVYLLTSHRSFSGAGFFAQAFKHFKMGKIVGEETGQPITCFGEIIFSELPNTKLTYVASDQKFYLPGATDKDMFHGTIPDYKVDADKAMDFVINMIKQNLNK